MKNLLKYIESLNPESKHVTFANNSGTLCLYFIINLKNKIVMHLELLSEENDGIEAIVSIDKNNDKLLHDYGTFEFVIKRIKDAINRELDVKNYSAQQ